MNSYICKECNKEIETMCQDYQLPDTCSVCRQVKATCGLSSIERDYDGYFGVKVQDGTPKFHRS